ncbi:conserved hypothetical protein [Ricinus communis]|uniref:Uncharacterized protein n=1 Tax=Ricinus communis TaxID=3988 RepID=B9S724_RICCO|nr:conserved hypothetical protein [Ricinus communis]
MEIGGLRNLRVLNLKHLRSLSYIPSGVLLKLSKLEELYVSNEFKAWESVEDGKTNASLKELESHPITALQICVSNFSALPKESVISNLRRFKIYMISTDFICRSYGKDSKNELYMEGDGHDFLAKARRMSALVRNTEYFV